MPGHSSSSEEETERLKEAIDRNFLTENLFNQSDEKVKFEHKKEVLPSLRKKPQTKIIGNNPLTIKVTPTCQLYVSKHLTKLLDQTIDDIEVKPLKKKKSTGGIKLLSSSKNYIVTDTSVNKDEAKSCNILNKINSEDSDIEKKAKEVAVSAEWVLSQQELKHWAPNTKGILEIIKCSKYTNWGKKKKLKKHKLKTQ